MSSCRFTALQLTAFRPPCTQTQPRFHSHATQVTTAILYTTTHDACPVCTRNKLPHYSLLCYLTYAHGASHITTRLCSNNACKTHSFAFICRSLFIYIFNTIHFSWPLLISQASQVKPTAPIAAKENKSIRPFGKLYRSEFVRTAVRASVRICCILS